MSLTIDYKQIEKRRQAVQKRIDSEVLRMCDPFVPFKMGNLKRSGTLGTKLGTPPGRIFYLAKYAKVQYYCGRMVPDGERGRGRRWFERMKLLKKRELLGMIQKNITGG